MSRFQISIKKGNGYIPLTLFSSEDSNHSPYSTFDESINFGENSQATLKFSIAAYVWRFSNKELNPFLSLLECGRVVRFDMDNYYKIDFVITKRTPRKIGQNIIFDIECIDYYRFFMSKRGVGLTYPFDEDDIEQVVPQDIRFLADKILSAQESEWRVSPFLVASDFKEESTDLTKKITFEISGSNQYNALLELATKFNAELIVDYRFKTISFKDKNKKTFNGYYRTDVNVSSFGYSEDFSNANNLLFVSGGTDEYDIAVTIPGLMPDNWRNYFRSKTEMNLGQFKQWDEKPFMRVYLNDGFFKEHLEEDENYAKLADAMPHMQNFVYDLTGSLNRGLIDQATYNNIKDAFKNFTIPSIQYETYYPDVVTMSFDVESIVANAKNQIDMSFSTYLLSKEIDDENFNQGAKYLNEVTSILSDPTFINKVKSLWGNDKSYMNKIYYGLIQEVDNYSTLLETKKESLQKVVNQMIQLEQEWVNKDDNSQYIGLEGQQKRLNDDIAYLERLVNEEFSITVGPEDSQQTFSLTGKYPYLFERLYVVSGVPKDAAQKLYDEQKSVEITGGLIGIVSQYEQQIKDNLTEIRAKYGEYIQEGVFVDDVELDPFALYNKATARLQNNLNIEKIDLSVIKADALEDCIVKSLEVGQYIRVVDNDLLPLLKTDKKYIKELRIASIDMQPRKPYDIKLTLEQFNIERELLKRIVRNAATGK